MSKKVISAKTLAALYPSNKWKTRAVIDRATKGAQKAYNEELLRIESGQKTYESIMKLATHVTKGVGSFHKSQLAGFDGNLIDYMKLAPDIQSQYKSKYKELNKKVMSGTNNEETLQSLYSKHGKNITGGKETRRGFGQKVIATDEKTGVEGQSGLDMVLNKYSDLKKVIKPHKPDVPVDVDEFGFEDSPEEKLTDEDFLEETFGGELPSAHSISEWQDSVAKSQEYWEKQQAMWESSMPNFAGTFDLVNNDGDRLEFMDRMMKLKPEERVDLLKSVKESGEMKEENREALGRPLYSSLDPESYRIIEGVESNVGGLKGLMQRLIPGGKTGKEVKDEIIGAHEEISMTEGLLKSAIEDEEIRIGRELTHDEKGTLVEDLYSGRDWDKASSFRPAGRHQSRDKKELMERHGIDEKYSPMFEYEGQGPIDSAAKLLKFYTPSGLWNLGKGVVQGIIPGGKELGEDMKGFMPEDWGQLKFKNKYADIKEQFPTGIQSLGNINPATGRPYATGTESPGQVQNYEDWLDQLYNKYYEPEFYKKGQ